MIVSFKELPMNGFGSCIMNEYGSFHFKFINIHLKHTTDNDEEIYTASFDWTWNCYEGDGIIDFHKSDMRVCNYYGEKNSYMRVFSNSKKLSHGRNECGIHNDKSLEVLFNKMLQTLNSSLFRWQDLL